VNCLRTAHRSRRGRLRASDTRLSRAGGGGRDHRARRRTDSRSDPRSTRHRRAAHREYHAFNRDRGRFPGAL